MNDNGNKEFFVEACWGALYIVGVVVGSVFLALAVYSGLFPVVFGPMIELATSSVPPIVFGIAAVALYAASICGFAKTAEDGKAKVNIREKLHKARHELIKKEIGWETRWLVSELGDVIEQDEKHSSVRNCTMLAKAMSYGKLDIDTDVFSPDAAKLEDEETKRAWRKKLADQQRLIVDMLSIWQSQLHGCSLGRGSVEQIREFGAALGIPEMLDAYARGVPLDDIIAG